MEHQRRQSDGRGLSLRIEQRGGLKNGAPQQSDERLFMQLLAFGGCRDIRAVTEAFAESRLTGVIYEDLNDPRGIAVLALSEDPDQFIDALRPMLGAHPSMRWS